MLDPNMLRPIARAATSDTAKDMAKTLREQAIDSTLNMTKDYLNGNDMQQQQQQKQQQQQQQQKRSY